jgi:Cu+-exporting ATPase
MNHSTTSSVTVTDPVCGMTIDPTKAVGSSTYNDRTYHFCSRGCETKFDSAPAEYADTAPAPAAASCCSSKTPAQPRGHSCC